MPNLVERISVNFRDVKGFSSNFKYYVSVDNAADAITLMTAVNTAAAGLTNAVFNGGNGVGLTPPNSTLYGANALFSTIEDKANLTFTTSAGEIHRWQIPAPKDAIFLADGETVDPANGLVLAFVNAMTTAVAGPSFVSNRSGVQLTHYIAGIRIRRKLRRRITIFTLDPTLTGPDE